MMENTSEKAKRTSAAAPTRKNKTRLRIVGYCCLAVLLFVIFAMLVDSMIHIFDPCYCTRFGSYRFVTIDTDEMSPAIEKGSVIVCKKRVEADIKAGDVIVFKTENGGGIVVRRIVRVETNDSGMPVYEVKRDAAASSDNYRPDGDAVIGVFNGGQIRGFGYFLSFVQSESGAISLFILLIVILALWVFFGYVRRIGADRKLTDAALQKSGKQLSNVNLRHENIREITAAIDVLDTITAKPKTRVEKQARLDRLNEFVNAATIELPKTPEVAAVLDSLPAPDTPVSLAAALRSGATLRQAEDGQTLILTGITGGKSFVLTPIQTPDGIILCQQGVHIRSALAPNIEDLGMSSMPDFPEFFEGKPLAGNVDYPLLPEPHANEFGPNELSSASQPMPLTVAYSVPRPIDRSRSESVGRIAAISPDKPAELPEGDVKAVRGRAFAEYREQAAKLELKQTEELVSLLSAATPPLTAEEQARLDEYKARKKQSIKKRGSAKPLTEEQRLARKAAADKKKADKDAFLRSLDPTERELYLAEQKLAKARNATIRKLKKAAADRKLLESFDGDR